ncbi:MAG: hypothetical protein QNJ18_12885 [Xenococcaceae cyanobacterium MO_167.B52]|nr:hypothetical protein [Xenococcaceae cyanobacterium MO_167.B52]
MGEYLRKITLATTISLLSLGTVQANQAYGAALFLGKYGFGFNSEKFFSSSDNSTVPSSVIFRRNSSLNSSISTQTSVSKSSIGETLDKSTSNSDSASKTNINSAIKDDLLKQKLEQQLNSLADAENLNQQIKDNYQTFLDRNNIESENLQQIESTLINEFGKYTDPDQINQDIRDRYQGLVEAETEQTSLLAARKMLISSNNEIGAEFNSTELDAVQVEESLALLQAQGWIKASPTQQQETIKFPLPLTISICLLIAWRSSSIIVPLLKALGYSIDQGIGEKYGSPKVPDNAVSLHDTTFKKVRSLAFKAQKIASEKFGNEEFILYVRLKQQVQRADKEYKTIAEAIKLLEVAIAAQSSFLKIESTELRFRSRKQQEFYQFVADNLEDDIDKDEFRNKIKQKLAEIIPLLNSEEGRAALQSYLKEVIAISQHNLGLKLLALFKKYQLADFTILKSISDIIKQLEARDLLDYKSLVVLILEHLEVFEKLAPIIGITEEDNCPETYAKMMQYMGLVHRHETAYRDFAKLIKLLKDWQKPYKSLVTIRDTYPADKYRVPPEFTKEIPGVAIFRKYEKYLESIG